MKTNPDNARSLHPAPGAEPLDPRLVVASCKRAHVDYLATRFIEDRLTGPLVMEQLALAGRVRDLVAAALGDSLNYREIERHLVSGAMGGTISAMKAALDLKFIDGEMVLVPDGHKQPRNDGGKPNFMDILDRRDAAARKAQH